MDEPTRGAPEDRVVATADLRESHASLRVLDGKSVRAMRESLRTHGQLTPLSVYPARDALEVVDGFKRLISARELSWPELRVQVLPVDSVAAKVAVSVLNRGRGLSEIEEAWVVRALYREDKLSQPEIGRRLGRDKSWVCRRLLLAEGLDETVQVDVRLGLLAASAAAAVGRLPRCNQRRAAEVVIGRAMTKVQTERLVSSVLSRPLGERDAVLDEALETLAETGGATIGPRRHERSPAESIGADIAVLVRICGRLQARLLDRPINSFGESAAQIVCAGLGSLLPMLCALEQTIERVTKGYQHAPLDDAPRA